MKAFVHDPQQITAGQQESSEHTRFGLTRDPANRMISRFTVASTPPAHYGLHPHHPSNFLARWPCRVIEERGVDWERLGVGMGGIETMAAAIGADLAARLPRQNKKQRDGLALLVATALDVRDVNLMELAAALPRGR